MNDLPTQSAWLRLPYQLLLLLLLSSLTVMPAVAQLTRYVSTTGTNTNPASATSWATSTTNLQGAVEASAAGDQVWVNVGLYKPGGLGHFDRDLSFSMKNGVGIYGGFIGSETALVQRPAITISTPSGTTLSGDIGILNNPTDNSFHLFNNPSGLNTTALLNGFVITGGNTNGASPETYGGGMYNKANGAGQVCSPQVVNCVFQNNTGAEGGAIYNNGNGGGVSSPAFTNCTFQNNFATSFGGAVLNDGGSGGTSSPIFTNCLFLGNSTTTGSGGALFNYGQNGISNPMLTNCSFLSNSAATGGAMYNDGGSGHSSPTLINCSLQGNTATMGGAAYNVGAFGGASTPSLTNCVLFNNGGANTFVNNSTSGISASYSLFDQSVTGYTSVTANITTTTTPFSSTSTNQLTICSPAVNAGNPATTSAIVGAFDLAGNPRFYDSTGTPSAPIDMGAYEVQTYPTVTITSQPAASSVACVGSTITLVVSVSGTATGFQWYKTTAGGSTTTVAGATSATLTLANVQTANAGSYSAVITGHCNSVTSTAFSLTVNPLATITGQPTANSVVCAGSTVTAFVSGSGTVSTYQWYQNGTLVSGQTSATLTLSNVQTANTGSYSVVLTGVCNSVTSTAFALLVNPTPARLYVRPSITANANQTGLSWADAFPDLQLALNYTCSQNLGEIWVASGLYKPSSGTARTLSFSMKPNVALFGGFAGIETTLSERVLTLPSGSTLSGNIGDPGSTSDNSYHVISNAPSLSLTNTAVLDGFVVTGGNADGAFPNSAGGAMLNIGNGSGSVCSPQIRHCLFISNRASSGGAIFNTGATGGNSSPTFTNCAFQNNAATTDGGAMYNTGFAGHSNPLLTNCTFLSNTATTSGGALFNDGGGSGQCNPQLINCLVFGNGGSSTFFSVSATATARYSLFEPLVTGYTSVTGNIITAVSPFVSATSIQLKNGSPAINTGDPATTSATVGTVDLAGNPRFFANAGTPTGRIDLGAIELQEVLEIYSLKNGNWNDQTLWSVERLPQLGERVRLKHLVSIPASFQALSGAVLYDSASKLTYGAGGRLQLGQ